MSEATNPAWAPQFRKLWAENVAPDQIAARMCISKPTVFARAVRLGLPSRGAWGRSTWSVERKETLTKLWQDGLSASQIAKHLGGVTRNAVIGVVHRMGLSGRAVASKPAKAPKVIAAPKPSPPKPIAGPARLPTAPMPAPQPYDTTLCPDLLHLGAHMCRWPIGDPQEDGFGFCGRETGGIYCENHAARAHQPATVKQSHDAAIKQTLRRYA